MAATGISTMTSRERWLAALDFQEVDRLPVWPKFAGAYTQHQAEPFRSMELRAVFDYVGADLHHHVPGCRTETRTKTSEEVQQSDTDRVTLFHTPHGTLRRRDLWDAPTGSWHPVEFPVKTGEDIDLMRAYYEDLTIEPDPAAAEQAAEQVRAFDETGVVATGMGESPLMHWVEWLAGVENAHYLLLDEQDRVEALFDAIQRVERRRTEVTTALAPADIFYMVENTSTTLISPEQYRTYCAEHIREVGEVARANGKRMILHMCGTLKDLLPQLSALPVCGFEAFTSPPVGNTTFVDGRAGCPDKCLIGGTNATLWTHPADAIIAEADAHLGALPHHRGLVYTSAGQMPPLARPDTIKAVFDWVKAYPLRF
ncbi:MAG: uroporphyrinogen decarboxylase family protein [Planctomycetota bacterium]